MPFIPDKEEEKSGFIPDTEQPEQPKQGLLTSLLGVSPEASKGLQDRILGTPKQQQEHAEGTAVLGGTLTALLGAGPVAGVARAAVPAIKTAAPYIKTGAKWVGGGALGFNELKKLLGLGSN